MFTAGWEPPKLTRRSSSYLSGGVVLLIVVVMVVSIQLEKQKPPPSNLFQSAPPPAYAAKAADGSEIQLTGGGSTPTLISFWATWCSECVDQLAALQAIQDEFEPLGLRVIPVSLDDQEPHWVQDFLEAGGHHWQTLFDEPGHVREVFGWGPRLPKSLLLNRDGTVSVWWRGSIDPELQRNRDLITAALAEDT